MASTSHADTGRGIGQPRFRGRGHERQSLVPKQVRAARCPQITSLSAHTSDAPLATMKGHADRVCRVAFHPSGDYVASASFDTSWRLWDVATAKELLLQEGHSKEVYSVEFQDDGALVASGSVPLNQFFSNSNPVTQRSRRHRACVGSTHRPNGHGPRRPRPSHFRYRLFPKRVGLLHQNKTSDDR